MKKKQLSAEEKRLDNDLWIILLVTLGVFFCYAAMGKQIMDYVKDDSVSIIPRLLLNAAVQFGVAGLGISIVCALRREKFTSFGMLYFFIRPVFRLSAVQHSDHGCRHRRRTALFDHRHGCDRCCLGLF